MRTITIELENEDGELEEVKFPAKLEVCSRCEGEGKHTNPSIDGNGITSEEMRELGDEFMEDYMNGVYDVQCEECGGERLIEVIDEDRCDRKLLERYWKHEREEAAYRAECEMERRMGA